MPCQMRGPRWLGSLGMLCLESFAPSAFLRIILLIVCALTSPSSQNQLPQLLAMTKPRWEMYCLIFLLLRKPDSGLANAAGSRTGTRRSTRQSEAALPEGQELRGAASSRIVLVNLKLDALPTQALAIKKRRTFCFLWSITRERVQHFL